MDFSKSAREEATTPFMLDVSDPSLTFPIHKAKIYEISFKTEHFIFTFWEVKLPLVTLV